jgi:ribose transport system permease protein
MPAEKSKASRLLTALGPFLILAFVVLLFALVMPKDSRETFFSLYSFKTILTQTVIVAIGALGMTMIIVSGGIDLSVGSLIALTSVLGAVLVNHGWTVPEVIGICVLAGGIVGLANGAIIAGFQMTPFIVTLGMLGIARGLAKKLANNQTVNFPSEDAVRAIGSLMMDPNPSGWAISPGIWTAIGLAGLTSILMQRTIFGRYIFAIGSNEATARLCGVRTRLNKLAIYTIAGMLFGVAGMMQLSRLRQGDPSTAIGIELDIIAAVVIGGASLNGGTGSILGSMIGALTMAVLRSGSIQSDWPNYMQEIIIGIVIILAVGLDKWRQSKGNG